MRTKVETARHEKEKTTRLERMNEPTDENNIILKDGSGDGQKDRQRRPPRKNYVQQARSQYFEMGGQLWIK